MYDRPADRLKDLIAPKLSYLPIWKNQKYHQEFWALKDVSFEVAAGECIGIIGQNGSGKSTLLQIIAGTMAPTKGHVNVQGKITALLELGSGFNPDFTGRENVYLNGSVLGLTQHEINEKFDWIASFADIGVHLDQPVKTYSSGMMLRLAFAVQAAIDMQILIVDEALAVGDTRFQLKCFKRLEELKSNGTTILFVSHGIELVRSICNRGLLLNKGEVIYWGDAKNATTKYYELLFPKEPSLAHFDEEPTNLLRFNKSDEDILADNSNLIPNNDPNGQDLVFIAQQSSWGRGGATIKTVKLKNLQAPNMLKQGDPLLAEIEIAFDLKKINELIKLESLKNNLFVSLRLDNFQGFPLFDLYSPIVIDQEFDDATQQKKANFFLECEMPVLQQGEYFLTPAIAVGSVGSVIPLCSYDFAIPIHIIGNNRVDGLLRPRYQYTEAC